MQIKIKYHNKNIDKITAIEKGDWIDLRAAETVELKTGEFRTISLGISAELPQGYEAHVAPRSSTFSRYGIIQTNGVGIVDNSYCGDNDLWMMPVYAVRDTIIRENDRICQFRLMKKMEPVSFSEVETLGNSDRGGFGSTGK